eukprot:6312695-Pyramimonas_sp.AAC.1
MPRWATLCQGQNRQPRCSSNRGLASRRHGYRIRAQVPGSSIEGRAPFSRPGCAQTATYSWSRWY